MTMTGLLEDDDDDVYSVELSIVLSVLDKWAAADLWRLACYCMDRLQSRCGNRDRLLALERRWNQRARSISVEMIPTSCTVTPLTSDGKQRRGNFLVEFVAGVTCSAARVVRSVADMLTHELSRIAQRGARTISNSVSIIGVTCVISDLNFDDLEPSQLVEHRAADLGHANNDDDANNGDDANNDDYAMSSLFIMRQKAVCAATYHATCAQESKLAERAGCATTPDVLKTRLVVLRLASAAARHNSSRYRKASLDINSTTDFPPLHTNTTLSYRNCHDHECVRLPDAGALASLGFV